MFSAKVWCWQQTVNAEKCANPPPTRERLLAMQRLLKEHASVGAGVSRDQRMSDQIAQPKRRFPGQRMADRQNGEVMDRVGSLISTAFIAI